MKKVLAGVLAALSVLSNTAPAYAAANKITEHGGEVEYEVSAELPDIVLKVILPAEMKAALNPYNNDFQIDDNNLIHSRTGVVSVAYPVYNLDTSYGVFIGATAVTTTSGKDWSVTTGALTPGVRGANMSLTASDTEEGITQYSNVKKAATSLTEQGNLPLDSTVPANKTKGTPAGQTSQPKLAYIPASLDGETEQKIFLGFTGRLADDSDKVILDWTENDYINVNLVLRLTPAPKDLQPTP